VWKKRRPVFAAGFGESEEARQKEDRAVSFARTRTRRACALTKGLALVWQSAAKATGSAFRATKHRVGGATKAQGAGREPPSDG
jgi:hypothetical protein